MATADAVREVDGLRVFAEPESTLLALATDGSCDVFTLADEMLARGWFVQPQLSYHDLPATLHLTLSAATAPSVPDFVMALQEATSVAREAGPVRIDPTLAGLVTSLDPSTLDEAGFAALLAAAGLAGEDGGVALPEQMAPINALLDVCPPALREVLLTGVLDLLSRPTRS